MACGKTTPKLFACIHSSQGLDGACAFLLNGTGVALENGPQLRVLGGNYSECKQRANKLKNKKKIGPPSYHIFLDVQNPINARCPNVQIHWLPTIGQYQRKASKTCVRKRLTFVWTKTESNRTYPECLRGCSSLHPAWFFWYNSFPSHCNRTKMTPVFEV